MERQSVSPKTKHSKTLFSHAFLHSFRSLIHLTPSMIYILHCFRTHITSHSLATKILRFPHGTELPLNSNLSFPSAPHSDLQPVLPHFRVSSPTPPTLHTSLISFIFLVLPRIPAFCSTFWFPCVLGRAGPRMGCGQYTQWGPPAPPRSRCRVGMTPPRAEREGEIRLDGGKISSYIFKTLPHAAEEQNSLINKVVYTPLVLFDN